MALKGHSGPCQPGITGSEHHTYPFVEDARRGLCCQPVLLAFGTIVWAVGTLTWSMASFTCSFLINPVLYRFSIISELLDPEQYHAIVWFVLFVLYDLVARWMAFLSM